MSNRFDRASLTTGKRSSDKDTKEEDDFVEKIWDPFGLIELIQDEPTFRICRASWITVSGVSFLRGSPRWRRRIGLSSSRFSCPGRAQRTSG